MGTLLYARGVSLDACFDVLNLNNPRVVQSIHADYIAAGADCIETNTFGANRFKLAVHGLDGQVREINRRGVALARDVRESSGRDVFVLGSIGPLGKYLAPLGTVTADGSGAWSLASTLAAGSHSLAATATDIAGNTATSQVQVTYVANRAPIAAPDASDQRVG